MIKNQVKHRKLGFFILTLIITAILLTTSSANIYPSGISIINNYEKKINEGSVKNQLSFAAFTDTHIGANYQYRWGKNSGKD